MRQIDADALKEKLSNWVSPREHAALSRFIDEAPTLELDEPRVLSLDELATTDFCYIELNIRNTDDETPYFIRAIPINWEGFTGILVCPFDDANTFSRSLHSYEKTWRCWNKVPSEEIRKETKWK